MKRFARVMCLPVCLMAAACAQGEGDRCEIDSDCDSNLRCLANVCRVSGTPTPTPGVDAAMMTPADASAPAVDASSAEASAPALDTPAEVDGAGNAQDAAASSSDAPEMDVASKADTMSALDAGRD